MTSYQLKFSISSTFKKDMGKPVRSKSVAIEVDRQSLTFCTQRRQRGGPKVNPKPRQDYDLSSGQNESFDKYYKAQGLLEEGEWDQFLGVAKAPLPLTFRITSSRVAAKAVNQQVEQVFVPHLSEVVFEGVSQQPPRPLEWYPRHLAWQLNAAKHVVRKSPEFAK